MLKKEFILLMGCICVSISTTWANNITTPQPRVIGGEVATAKQMPWQVALINDINEPYQSYICSGSLLTDRWVVTAAHCIDHLTPQNQGQHAVLVGTTDLTAINQAQLIKIKKHYIHQQYNNRTYDNDIALLELATPVNFDLCQDRCQTIDWMPPILEASNAPIGRKVQIAGWGVLEDCKETWSEACQQQAEQSIRLPQIYPTQLRYGELQISSCLSSQSFYRPSQISNNMLCAETTDWQHPTDTCFGDSGTGLIIQEGLAQPYLLGIASWGVGCAVQGYAGVYTRVANYENWLTRYIYPERNIEQEQQQPSIETKTQTQKSGGSVDIMLLLFLFSLVILRIRKVF